MPKKQDKSIAERGKATQFKSGEKAVACGHKGGINSQKVQHTKKSLKQIFEIVGDSTPLELVQAKLRELGYDVADMSAIEALVKIASIRAADSTTSLNDLIKFIELFARYTGQEPAKETKLTGSLGLKKVFVTEEQQKAVEEHIADVVGEHR